MSIAMQEICILIEHYKVLEREVALEGPEQIATITRVMKRNIPLTIDKLKRLKELEKLVPELLEENRKLGGSLHGKSAS